MFSITVVNVDSYQASPISGLDAIFSEFRGSDIKKVPIIRIFGSTATGEKTCLHIHGVFPYLYVSCTVQENIDSFVYRLATAIDSALNISFGSTLSTNQHVYKIQHVSGIPFYGYHEKEHLFLKIYFYNPALVKRTADLLQNGSVLSQNFQPYEAHIPYILQFMIDYNVYGMNLININCIKYRHCLKESVTEDSQNKDSVGLLDLRTYLSPSITKQSICEIEIDTCASDILNRHSITKEFEMNPGIAAIWNDEKARRVEAGLKLPKSQSLYSIISNEIVLPPTSNDIYQEGQLLKRLNAISQIDETISSNTSIHSYPIEVEDNKDLLSAFHVLSHSESFASVENLEKNTSDDNRLSRSHSLISSEVDQSPSNMTNTTLLDEDDIQLVEMLVNLAEEDEISNVDNDSVLGSQYSVSSEKAKHEPEEEEVEDLNITSLDLDIFSSWESTYKEFNQHESNQDNNVIKDIQNKNNDDLSDNSDTIEQISDVTLMNLPQFDGVDNLCEDILEYKMDSINYLNNTDNMARYTIIQYFLKNVNYTASVINATKYRSDKQNFHGNMHLANIIKHILDNSNPYYIKKALYNFASRKCFHIFIKTSKNFYKTDINSVNIDINAGTKVIKEICSSKSNKKDIIYNDKFYRKLYTVYYEQQIDHQDLDVYDIDEIKMFETEDINKYNVKYYQRNRNEQDSKSYPFWKAFLNSDYCKLPYLPKLPNFSMKFEIPNIDGATATDSSDSEIESNITIEEQEKRTCVYKSRKEAILRNITQTTPKKRKFEFDNDDDYQSTSKPKNTNVKTPRKQFYNSPSTSRSPRCLSGNYSPLNIVVMSPKTSRSPIRKYDSPKKRQCLTISNVASTSTTPKRDINTNKFSNISVPNETEITAQTTVAMVEATIVDQSIEDHEQRTQDTEHLVLKGGKEVRKRLYFLNHDELENTIAESSLQHASQSENLITLEHSVERTDVDAVMFSSSNESEIEDIVPSSPHTKKTDDDMSPDRSYASGCQKNNLTKELMKVHDVIPETDEDEEDVCNTTFSQYINQKLENDSQSSSLGKDIYQSPKDITVTITTKYNPPTPERILESMTLYRIPKCKSKKPFFSNKSDLMKQKDSLNKNILYFDIPAFKSSLEEITGIKLWRRMKVNEFYPSGASIKTCRIKRTLAGYNVLTIKPLIAPPSNKDIENWMKAKKYLLKKNCNVESHTQNKEKALLYPEDIRVKVNDEHQSETSWDHSVSNNSTEGTSLPLTREQNVCDSFGDNKKFDYASHSDGSQHIRTSGGILNPSLQKAVDNLLLYKHDKTCQQLGFSYGQIEYLSRGSYGNVSNENLQNVRAITAYQHLTLLSLEVHVVTRGDLLPDPQYDSIAALFYAIYNDTPTDTSQQIEHGAIIVNPHTISIRLSKIHSASTMCPILYVPTERDMMNSLINMIEQHNPDILVGWEVETLSWGYVLQRAFYLDFSCFPLKISKVPYMQTTPKFETHMSEKDDIGEIKIPGRNILDVWRIMRHEAALLTYTFENVMHHVLHERISCPPFSTLSFWWKQENILMRCRVIRHYVTRVVGTLKILNHLDIIGRTCEYARLFGIQFYEVFSRGSQFRVESMMLRLAKPLNYIPISPSTHQRAKMRAPECLPLIMEPRSEFYTDPLIVLDFQSLYPSMIIAYNYCFSTCLGRIEHIGQFEPFEFGAGTLRVKKSTALKLQDKINFSPCGVAFVKKEVRQGILPRMLTEILNTRLMVKESMKLHPAENRRLQKILHSQQLGLKLIANVTYGYTSANFSGRMPCIEIGDSVVSKGRETLERAIKLVECTPKWGAQVVYGDTDSMFVLLPGKTREEAFTIGEEIADAVTASNPPPVKLKFEKVLHPCILQTKKRYCGYMYETHDQKEPEFLGKGIETIRRDGCPAVAKILEKALKILFDTKDISLLKSYIIRQFDKIFRQRVSLQDLTFAKEFRGMQGYKENACVPALELTRRLMKKDPRAVPRTSERVRYIIVAGAPNQPLIHCVRAPMEVLADPNLIPNSMYYVTKVIIPPLNRCFNLFGIDVNTWYKEMPHRQGFHYVTDLQGDNPKSTIRQFFSSTACITCGEQTNKEICSECLLQPNRAILIILDKIKQLERTHQQIAAICHSCIGQLGDIECVSLDCPVLYRRIQACKELAQVPHLNNVIYGNNSVGITGLNAAVE